MLLPVSVCSCVGFPQTRNEIGELNWLTKGCNWFGKLIGAFTCYVTTIRLIRNMVKFLWTRKCINSVYDIWVKVYHHYWFFIICLFAISAFYYTERAKLLQALSKLFWEYDGKIQFFMTTCSTATSYQQP